MSVMSDHADRAMGLAHEHPGWIVWTSRPIATRASTGQPPRKDGTYSQTLVADSWDELDAKLKEQDAADADADWTQT